MPRPPLVLLHGALGAQVEFDALTEELRSSFEVHRLDFEGHGRSGRAHRAFRIEHFAENVARYLDESALPSAHVFGFSMGGYVGLYLARQEPARVRSLATLGTKLEWTEEAAAREVKLLDPEKLKLKVPAFARELELRHAAVGYETVLGATAELLQELGLRPRLRSEDFSALTLPVRLMLGDRDKTVTIEETLAAYRCLARGELEILPATAHPFAGVAVRRLATSLREFFGRDA